MSLALLYNFLVIVQIRVSSTFSCGWCLGLFELKLQRDTPLRHATRPCVWCVFLLCLYRCYRLFVCTLVARLHYDNPVGPALR